MTPDASRQGGDNALALRRDPASAAIPDHLRTQYQVLHHESLITLETRSGRAAALSTSCSTIARGADLPRLRCLLRRDDFGVVAFSIPLGLIVGRPFKPFSRAISSRCSPTTRPSSATLPSSCTTSCRSSAFDKPVIVGGSLTISLNQADPRRRKQNVSSRPDFCAGAQKRMARPVCKMNLKMV